MEPIVYPPEDKKKYSKRAIFIQSLFIFIGYIFVFLAGATELQDVFLTFFNIPLTPRQSLLIISILQIMVWVFWGLYPEHKDKSFAIVGYLFFISLTFYITAETILGSIIFGSFLPGIRTYNTVLIIINIIIAAGYTSLTYYKNSQTSQK